MGAWLSTFWNKLAGGPKEMRIAMIGLDAAGKTTALYKLKLGDVLNTMPTIGFNVESIEYKNVRMTVWDVGGQDRIRPLWRHYYQGTQGVIFVVDSADVDRMDESNPEVHAGGSAKEELARCLAHDELRDAVLLVLANKQDIKGALKPSDVAERLGLAKLRNRQWRIQLWHACGTICVPAESFISALGCSAKTGDGLYEGLDWLAETLKKVEKGRA